MQSRHAQEQQTTHVAVVGSDHGTLMSHGRTGMHVRTFSKTKAPRRLYLDTTYYTSRHVPHRCWTTSPHLTSPKQIMKNYSHSHGYEHVLEMCSWNTLHLRLASHMPVLVSSLVSSVSTLFFSKRCLRIFFDLGYCSTVIRFPEVTFGWRPTRFQGFRDGACQSRLPLQVEGRLDSLEICCIYKLHALHRCL